jgi:hypothetical protein
LAAEIIHHYLPDMINTHNYISNSSLIQKKINWQVLNKRVLNRIGINLPEAVINNLSNGKAGSIEIFLFNLRLKIDEEIELRQKIGQQSTSSPRQSLLSSNINSSINVGKPILTSRKSRTSRSMGNLSHRWISRLDYEELKHESLQQQEQIEIIQAKMRRLEHVVQLKDTTINELSTTVEAWKRTNPKAFINNKPKKN